MASQSFDPNASSADDSAHLSRLRSLVERVMADGKISPAEAHELRAALMVDGQITADEVDVIRQVMRQQLGNSPLEFE